MKMKHAFTMVDDRVLHYYEDPLTALVYGRVERYAQNKKGYCWASQGEIANQLCISRDTVRNRLEILINDGFIDDDTPGKRNRSHHLYITGIIEELPYSQKDSDISNNKREVTKSAAAKQQEKSESGIAKGQKEEKEEPLFSREKKKEEGFTDDEIDMVERAMKNFNSTREAQVTHGELMFTRIKRKKIDIDSLVVASRLEDI